MALTAISIVLMLLSACAGACYLGRRRWRRATRSLSIEMDAARATTVSDVYGPHLLEGLPRPVQRYLRTVLKEGQPLICRAEIKQSGTFNTSEGDARWKPFTATQCVRMRRPGFVWNASIAMAPGVPVRVHDAYVAGEGVLHASLLGLVTVAEMRGTPDIAQGELMRFLAEAVLYPTVLLPGQDVRWTAIDDAACAATIQDGANCASLTFRFDASGLVDTVRAEARGRTVGSSIVPTPWVGRWWNYSEQGGMLVPIEGEVAWILPDGPRPYWRGRMVGLKYAFLP